MPALRAAQAPGPAAPGPDARQRHLVVPGLLVTALVALVVGCVLLDARSTDAERALYVSERGVVSGAIGALVGLCGAAILTFRPRHVVGLVLAGAGAFWALDGFCESYAVVGLHEQPILPLTGLAYWVVSEAGSLLLVALPLVLVLYPTGRLPEGRWRTVAVAALVMSLTLPLSLVLAPDSTIYDGRLPDEVVRLLPQVALPWSDAVAVAALHVGQVLTLLAMPLAAATVFARHSHSTGVERTQLRWLLWAAIVCLLAGGVMLLDVNGPVGFAALVLALVATSVSVVVGVVRPETGDIDALVGGTLVYGGIAALFVLLDLGVVAAAAALLGDRFEERQVTVLVLVLAVAAYGPLRSWLTAQVRRRVLGRRG